jgi:hypothetical protein
MYYGVLCVVVVIAYVYGALIFYLLILILIICK